MMALDVRAMTPLTDYFLIVDASNERQVQAIVDSIIETCHKHQIEIKSVEGKNGSKWILIDLGEVVVHVFYYSERAYYNLEKIWLEAPLVDISQWID